MQEVWGVTDWDTESLGFDYDAEAGDYISGLEFGFGFTWACGEIGGCELDWDQGTVRVDFTAEYLFPGASSTEEEKTSWPCRNTFSMEQGEQGITLRFEKTEFL